MQHLRHLRLLTYKGLKGATLCELGKINVLCGPNNSGKTTVLECIAAHTSCKVGIDLTKEIAEAIAEQGLRGGVGWGGNDPQMNSRYRRSVVDALTRRPVWFSDDAEALVRSVDWSFAGSWANPTGNLTHAFTSRFPTLPQIVLVPAKRRLEAWSDVQAHEEIRPDGGGVLNFLFTAKNKEESSPLRKKFDAITAAFTEISGGYEFGVFIQERATNMQPPPTRVQNS